MDPISAIFAAYIEAVSLDIHSTMTETMGTELKAMVIEYEGETIPFQYQMWRVRDKSVCASSSHDTIAYSRCTMKAQSMFQELCSELSRNRKNHWKYVKTQNMYCNAAVSFSPTVATISAPSEQTTAQAARQRCNVAIANAVGSSDPARLAERNTACTEYEKIKAD
ncbi:hypothetical protein [Marinimicrobium sp. ABcell2]|uniref:hypothetical protein n=1 Tax=Marinimicrobium sp. ABcell2 TaxID=3069751 RepID=UPI0027B2AC13|nr:hypothetical protein [Marinimicrobium sp. ABcell2]MDQ2076869.1 hypothetical protein [Marinimicrobium sp. ABcell2]